jgi:hypothetical protein
LGAILGARGKVLLSSCDFVGAAIIADANVRQQFAILRQASLGSGQAAGAGRGVAWKLPHGLIFHRNLQALRHTMQITFLYSAV